MSDGTTPSVPLLPTELLQGSLDQNPAQLPLGCVLSDAAEPGPAAERLSPGRSQLRGLEMTFFVAESPERHVRGLRAFASRGSWHGHLQSPDRLAGHLGRVCRREQAER